MRKIIALALVGLFVIAPSALVTANGSWGDISRTLGEIHKTLGNINVLIGGGTLEDDGVGIYTLLRETNIPLALAQSFEKTSAAKSGRYEAGVDFSYAGWTRNKNAKADVNVKASGAIDALNEKVSSDFVIKLDADRDFNEVVFGDDFGFIQAGSGQDFTLDISSFVDSGDFYFRFNKLPRDSMLDFLKKHEGRWIFSSAREFAEDVGVKSKTINSIGSMFGSSSGGEKEVREMLKAYIRYPLFDIAKQSDVRIGGNWYSSYKLSLRTENVTGFVDMVSRALDSTYTPPTESEKRESERTLAKTKADILIAIDEQSSEVKRVSLDLSTANQKSDLAKGQYYNPEMEKKEVVVRAELDILDLNQKINFTIPVSTIPFEEILWDLFDSITVMISQEEEEWDWSK